MIDERPNGRLLPAVAVLIATKNRASELANRALRSVAQQTWAPDFLAIVDDSDRRHRDDNRRIATHAPLSHTRIKYLENDRTPGASGAWNVGLDWLTREVENPRDIFVAILDDDDEWDRSYLEACLIATTERDLDMVAADIARHETLMGPAAICAAPDELDPRAFLVRNPHIQGSNLFARLSTLLAAGTFDESLRSTTDRDICIRVADLGAVRYGRLARALVHHYADSGRDRLSSPGSEAKLTGLTAFWKKYVGRMTAAEREAFADRAAQLFGWEEPRSEWPTLNTIPAPTPDSAARVALIVGVIASASSDRKIETLVQSLAALTRDARLANLDVLLLENGPRSAAHNSVARAAERARQDGIACFVLSIEQQAKDTAAGRFGKPFERGDGRASIATARTMLQRYLYDLAKHRPGAIVWILDEDMHLETLVWRDGRGIASEPVTIVDVLARLRDLRVDIAIGTVTDAPPLPFASCVRTQLVDAYHNLEWFAALDPDGLLPDRSAENMALRARNEDYYYDLSRRETDHLEAPFWLTPPTEGASVRDTFVAAFQRFPRILAGEQVFRALVVDGAVDPVAARKPSVHRGGNAFVFDPEALHEFPNAVPIVDGQSTRRSDMVWSLLNRYVGGRTVVRLPFAVRQDRRHVPSEGLDLDKLCRDIQGFALYSALEALFLEKLEAHRAAGGDGVADLAGFDEQDVAFTLRKFRKFLRERTAAFVLSFHRAAGLAHALGRYFDAENAVRYWWLRDPACHQAIAAAREFLIALRGQYDLARLDPFRSSVSNVADDVVTAYLTDLGIELAGRRTRMDESPATWIDRQRVENARAWISRKYGIGPEALAHLGSGSEAVVLTDGVRVFKCLDYWKGRDHEERLGFLRSLVGRFEQATSLYAIEEVRVERGRVVITYPYEPSRPYRGGHASGLITLLHDCRRVGVVCSNIHPDNLVVVGECVKLIDYGSDIQSYDDVGFRRMARRAFLTIKHTEHPDLKILMRRSINDETLPELDGFTRFWAALHPPSKDALVDDRLVEIICKLLPTLPVRVLDYGCGRGRLAARLAREGCEVTGYDPDSTLHEHWRRQQNVRFIDALAHGALIANESKSFDTVVCCLVLCTLRDDAAAVELARIRALTRVGGTVLLVVCNPRGVGCHTALQHRILPNRWRDAQAFEYAKVVRSSGRVRQEVHRCTSRYHEMIVAAGLCVERSEETPAVDVETMEPTSDFLILQCRTEVRDVS